MPRMTLRTRPGFFLLFVAAFALVGIGWWIGEWMHLNPCPLCIFQRVLYLLIGLLALPGVVWPNARGLWGSLIAATAAGGVATAVYQTWLQQNPDSAAQCGYGEPTLIEQLVDWLGMQWPEMFMATGFCSTKEYILGLTMANWSILCFAGFLAAGLWLGWLGTPQRARLFR